MLKARQSTTVPFDINFSLEILEKFGNELLMQDSILVTGKFEGDFTMFDLHKKEDIEYWMKTKDIMDKIYEKFLGNDGLDISKKIKSITPSTIRIDLKTTLEFARKRMKPNWKKIVQQLSRLNLNFQR
jgi:hypothetical protein